MLVAFAIGLVPESHCGFRTGEETGDKMWKQIIPVNPGP